VTSSPPTTWLARAARTATGHRDPFVLCYHGVGAVAADPSGLFISRDLFVRHLELIARRGYTLVGVEELWSELERDSGAPGKGSIGFDDALSRSAREAVAIVLERGMRCSLFVATGLMGREHPDVPGERVLEPAEVRELAAAGVEIGAHSVDHVWLPGLDDAALAEQLRRSRAELEDLIGAPVQTMAYPYGGHDERVERAAAAAGYRTACACSGAGPWRALALPREPVHPSTSPLRLRLKMDGLYGPVHALLADSGPIGRLRRRGGGGAGDEANGQAHPHGHPGQGSVWDA
jgi:peptidoglycan/xylan/chitin deacetylase (PgdA/CDA1 family)